MTTPNQQAEDTAGHDVPAHDHPPFLAHHYDTPEQQFASGKIGMWVLLATEILMFGGLFCAYAVYRYNHPEVFLYAHHYLDKNMGALNTVILITSSLTMAWAVRLAQLNRRRGLIVCLALTLAGGGGFMVVKSFEYLAKYQHHLWVGEHNRYDKRFNDPAGGHAPFEKAAENLFATPSEHVAALQHQSDVSTRRPGIGEEATADPGDAPVTSGVQPRPLRVDPLNVDPNVGLPDEPTLKPRLISEAGLAAAPGGAPGETNPLPTRQIDRERISTFFSIYFLMTGLHGFHVLIGMGLITWILVRTLLGHFSSQYFAPVDLVGLYWHLVDLIWIFLFPLLYLIH